MIRIKTLSIQSLKTPKHQILIQSHKTPKPTNEMLSSQWLINTKEQPKQPKSSAWVKHSKIRKLRILLRQKWKKVPKQKHRKIDTRNFESTWNSEVQESSIMMRSRSVLLGHQCCSTRGQCCAVFCQQREQKLQETKMTQSNSDLVKILHTSTLRLCFMVGLRPFLHQMGKTSL